jgi:RimJ/RimL family protein N-acetyltransferase
MEFRIAGEEDIDSLSEMRWIHSYHENNEFNVSKEEFMKECGKFLKKGMEMGNWVYWVAEDKGQIVSNIYIQKIKKVPKPHKLNAEIGYITNVHTKEKYRNMGIGTQLLKKVIEWAKTTEIELLFLWPSKRAAAFYERAGFSSQNEIIELTLDGE